MIDPHQESFPGEPNPETGCAAAVLPRDRLDEVYVRHAPLMRRIAMNKFYIPAADGEDLVDDVFVSLIVNVEKVRSPDLLPYLIGAICNASRKYWRAHGGSRINADSAALDQLEHCAGDDAENTADVVARNLAVAKTLARLDSRCREALRLYYLDDEETPHVADVLQTTCANVNYLMHVCRKRARLIYERITRATSDGD